MMARRRPALTRSVLLVLLGVIAGAALSLVPHRLSAQGAVVSPATPPDTGAVLSARVIDHQRVPVADAEVYVVELDRTVRTGASGVIRLSGVRAGRYTVSARKVGYLPASATLVASTTPTTGELVLVAYTTRLAPSITTARRTGLSGFVSDTALRPLPRALVKPAGSGRAVRTDTGGQFYIDLRPGTYLVGVQRDSFVRQTVAVTIPQDTGREIAIWMVPRDRAGDRTRRAEEIMEETRLFDLDQRMIRVSRQSARFYSRDQLLALGHTDLMRLARQWAQGSISAECTISVVNEGGRPYPIPLAVVETDAVEFVELYQRSPTSRQGTRGVSLTGLRTTMNAATLDAATTSSFCGNLAISVWLRR